MHMEIREISSEDLVDDGDRWTKPRLVVENPDMGLVVFLDKELRTLNSRKSATEIPVFWVDPERMKSMDTVWSPLPGAIKVVVSSGRRQGFVGYVRVT